MTSRPIASPEGFSHRPRSIDAFIDRAVASMASLSPMFADGWGDPEVLRQLVGRFEHLEPPKPIEIHWRPGARTPRGLYRFRGHFATPAMSLPLPPESRTAYVELVLPEDAFRGELPPVCLHLAGTGDATYVGRRLLAAPLASEHDIGALILQNPFYGERKPPDQSGTALRRITDQFMMNLATIQEARALLDWLRREGYRHTGVTGYSMGGYMAAMTAQHVDSPLAAIPCATGDTAVYPLVESPLSKTIAWETLERQLPGDISARTRIVDLMERFALRHHGSLEEPRAAIVVGGLQDAFIQPDDVARLHAHWEGSELRWMEAGHTTGWLLHSDVGRAAIADAFERLERLETS